MKEPDGEKGGRRPRVSVVMCTCNGARYLREQMDSILAQDCPPYEIVVQDDLSDDGTWEMLEAYRAARPELFRLYRNETRLGFNRNFHTAILRAEGDFIALSDQDDIWFPSKLRRQVEAIGEADVCFTDYYTDPEYRLPLKVRVSPRTDIEHLLFYDCTPGHTMLLRQGFAQGIERWDYNIYYDWWLSFHALMGRGLVKVAEPLDWHRHHAASATTHIYRKGFWEAVERPTWQPYAFGYLHRLHLQRKHNWHFFYAYLAEHIPAGRYPAASRMAALMNRRDPLSVLRLCLLCGRYYDRVYPGKPTGWKGRVRGFFYPLISAYGNDLFKLEK